MPIALRRFTIDELDRFPPDQNRYELLDGVLFVTPAPGPLHEELVLRLGRRLAEHVDPWPDLHVAARSEVALHPDCRLEPDLLVYRADRLPSAWVQVVDHWLAVEVASPSTRAYDRAYKLDAYLALGVREAWLVDPRDRTVLAGRPGNEVVTLHPEIIWHPPLPTPPLSFATDSLFQGLPQA